MIDAEMTLADAAKIAREEAAKHSGDVRTALTMLLDAVQQVNPENPDNPGYPDPTRLDFGGAIAALARIAAEGDRTVDDVNALELGARRILCRAFQKARSRARRRANWDYPAT